MHQNNQPLIIIHTCPTPINSHTSINNLSSMRLPNAGLKNCRKLSLDSAYQRIKVNLLDCFIKTFKKFYEFSYLVK